MQEAEGTGKTQEEAQQNALDQLGVSADRVRFEEIERPGGFGGIFGRNAYRVRAIVEDAEMGEEEAGEMQESSTASGSPHERLAEAGRDLLQQMVDLMEIDGRVKIEACSEEEVVLNVEGEEMGLLIGRHGTTLDAIQLIVAIGANRAVNDGARVIVDAEGYRARHQEMVEARARSLAEEAKAQGKEVVVPNLKAYERRLMHMALKDDPSVKTYSEGEGEDRILVISPV